MARGHLRVYLGAAPGVGKTYAMLSEGHRRLERGTRVLVAFVEDHGRPQTRAMLDGLEVVPRHVVEHRGTRLQEMDLAAVLARHPEVALVDELAHTNVPGARARQAVAGRRDAARCGDRRHHHRQRPAPRVAQRHRRGHHRDATERDGSRPGRPCCRPDRARGHVPRGAASSAGARERLCAGQGGRRAVQLLPRRQPHRAARARAALGRRPGRGGPRALSQRARHQGPVAGPRASRRRADRRTGGRHPDPSRCPDRRAGRRRRAARRARRGRRRAGRQRPECAERATGSRRVPGRLVPHGRRHGHRRGAARDRAGGQRDPARRRRQPTSRLAAALRLRRRRTRRPRLRRHRRAHGHALVRSQGWRATPAEGTGPQAGRRRLGAEHPRSDRPRPRPAYRSRDNISLASRPVAVPRARRRRRAGRWPLARSRRRRDREPAAQLVLHAAVRHA